MGLFSKSYELGPQNFGECDCSFQAPFKRAWVIRPPRAPWGPLDSRLMKNENESLLS